MERSNTVDTEPQSDKERPDTPSGSSSAEDVGKEKPDDRKTQEKSKESPELLALSTEEETDDSQSDVDKPRPSRGSNRKTKEKKKNQEEDQELLAFSSEDTDDDIFGQSDVDTSKLPRGSIVDNSTTDSETEIMVKTKKKKSVTPVGKKTKGKPVSTSSVKRYVFSFVRTLDSI